MDDKDVSSRGDSKAVDEKDGSPPKSALAKPSRGRRERRAFADSADDKTDGASTIGGGSGAKDTISSQSQQQQSQQQQQDGTGSGEVPKPRRRRQADDAGDSGGGWMTSGGGGSGGSSRATQQVEEEEDARDVAPNTNNKDKHFQDDGDEIVLIPDLDEEGGADADQRIAHAPKNVHRKIPTLNELESEVKAAVSTSDDGLRLNVLLSTLVPAVMVQEGDQLWTFESLLREITDELTETPKTVVHTYIPGLGKEAGNKSAAASADANANAAAGGSSGAIGGFTATTTDSSESKAQSRSSDRDRK